MKAIRYFYVLLIACILLILSAQAYAYHSLLTEKTVKNFTYHLLYSDEKVRLKNGEYESPLRPGNKEDMENFIKVKLVKYLITESFEAGPVAVVILAESGGGSGSFFQITALVEENGEFMQTNSIELGDRVVIKDLKFSKGNVSPSGSRRDEILLTLLTHRETDPSCCPSKMETKCFTLIRDENRKIKLLTCEEAVANSINERKEGVIIKDGNLIIRVASGGCTKKEDIKFTVEKNKVTKESSSLMHYKVTFYKFVEDRCKAFFPEGVSFTYSLEKDLGINTKEPFEIEVNNYACPPFAVQNCERTFTKVELENIKQNEAK